jgi:hypothetical protein
MLLLERRRVNELARSVAVKERESDMKYVVLNK